MKSRKTMDTHFGAPRILAILLGLTSIANGKGSGPTPQHEAVWSKISSSTVPSLGSVCQKASNRAACSLFEERRPCSKNFTCQHNCS